MHTIDQIMNQHREPDKSHAPRPKIDYPCRWAFRVIGADERALRAAIAEILADDAHSVQLGNVSSGGKYRSIHVEMTVRDEAHRNAVFRAIQAHQSVRFVL